VADVVEERVVGNIVVVDVAKAEGVNIVDVVGVVVKVSMSRTRVPFPPWVDLDCWVHQGNIQPLRATPFL
jgi:hypothetical protein